MQPLNRRVPVTLAPLVEAALAPLVAPVLAPAAALALVPAAAPVLAAAQVRVVAPVRAVARKVLLRPDLLPGSSAVTERPDERPAFP